MTIEPGTTMREWEKRRRETNAVDPVVPDTPDPLITVLERIATALETIAKRPTL